jgi:putative serine protease PepD
VPGLLGLSAGAVAAAFALASCSSSTPASTSGSSGSSAPQLQQQFENTVKSVLPSVVHIKAGNSTGSGVVYDDKGDIVTNDHVVAGATQMQVAPATGGQILNASLVGAFAADDLAVIRVSGGSLKPATFGESSSLRIGQIVLAMGNPLGLAGSVSEGIVSATGRTVSEGGSSSSGQGSAPIAVIGDAIQTSAAINPGNSGGALVDLSDQVIGIPTLGAINPSLGSAAPGIGFAIPSDTVKNIAGQLISSGKVTNSGKASLGISSQTVADQSGNAAGVGVAAVTASGPAADAGIRTGDVITEVGGKATPDSNALATVLAQYQPGQKVPVKFVRNGQTSTVQVTLGTLGSS